MKNSAVLAMIAKQFPQVELCDIRVIFEASIGGIEEYSVSLVEEDVVRQFKLNVEFREIAIDTDPSERKLKENVRVVVNSSAGFNVGARGSITHIDPDGKKFWVLRDHSASPCWYYKNELDFEDSK